MRRGVRASLSSSGSTVAAVVGLRRAAAVDDVDRRPPLRLLDPDDDDAVALDEEDERLERCVRRGRVGILVPPLTLAARDDNLRNHNAAGADAVAC